jgi:hypothetical protein
LCIVILSSRFVVIIPFDSLIRFTLILVVPKDVLFVIVIPIIVTIRITVGIRIAKGITRK